MKYTCQVSALWRARYLSSPPPPRHGLRATKPFALPPRPRPRTTPGLQVYGRTKSLFSTLKKLLRLGEMARGGRRRAEIYDLMGVRLVVQPRSDLPPEEAEAAAAQVGWVYVRG